MTNPVHNRTREIALVWVCLIALAPLPASADAEGGAQGAEGDPLKTRFIIDDADPESKVPSAKEALGAPLQMGYWVMLVSERAEQAAKRGDLGKAVKYYRALAKAAPNRAVGFTKTCETYEAMGDWKDAVDACATALEREGVTIADHEHYVRLVLSKPQALTPVEIAKADAVIAHLAGEIAKFPAQGADAASPEIVQGRKLLVERLKCQLGARLQDRKRLESCTSALRRIAPQDPAVVAFSFALALTKADLDEAERLIADAKRFGLNDAGVALMRGKLSAELEKRPLLLRIFGNARAIAVIGLVLLAGLALLARRRLVPVGNADSGRRHAIF
jgi:tetratricopeptide (TPR) repeat protein